MSGSDSLNVDPALLDLFRAEMDAHIPALSQGLLELEKGRAGEQNIAAMMRAAHSIKGAARIVGIEAAVRLAHVMEDCFSAAKEARTPLVGPAVDVLLQGVDALQRICALEPESELTEASLAALHERLVAVKEGRLPVDQADRSPPASGGGTLPLTAPSPPEGELSLVLPVEVDEVATETLRTQLCGALQRRAPRIRLDFSQVRGLSAGALALLVAVARETSRFESPPVLCAAGLSGSVATLLRVTGLDRAWAPES
jgi:two-component system sensor histidine kinase and response regulator WspE